VGLLKIGYDLTVNSGFSLLGSGGTLSAPNIVVNSGGILNASAGRITGTSPMTFNAGASISNIAGGITTPS